MKPEAKATIWVREGSSLRREATKEGAHLRGSRVMKPKPLDQGEPEGLQISYILVRRVNTYPGCLSKFESVSLICR